MKVTGTALKLIDRDRQLEITLKTDDGKLHVFVSGKNMARQLMRAIFGQIGIDPKIKERGATERKPTWLE